MTTTILTPSISFSPIPLTGLADGGTALPSPKPAANDARPLAPESADEYGRLLSDPRVRAFLWGRLKPINIPDPDKKNLVGTVLATLWRRRTDRYPVRTLERMQGLGRTILEGRLVDYWRRQKTAAGRTVDAPRTTPAKDAVPLPDKPWNQPNYVEELRPPRSITPEDSLHTKQQMQYVNDVAAKIGLTNDDVEVMFAIAWDETATYDELAAERGVKPGALRTRIHRLQKAVREGWNKRVKRTLILTLLLLAMLLLYVLAAIGPARNPPPPVPLPEPTVHEVAPVAPTTTAELPPEVPTSGKPRVR